MDQDVRGKLVEWAKENRVTFESKELWQGDRPLVRELLRIDGENRKWLKEVVDQYGWPGRTLVGADGAHAAFVLVQHANRDLAFQERCLRLMRQAPKGDVEPADLAYLTDRVRLAQGKGQLYGSQVEIKDGRWQPREVEDPENLDRRRREMGLPPIAVYLEMVQRLYGSPAKDTNSLSENRLPLPGLRGEGLGVRGFRIRCTDSLNRERPGSLPPRLKRRQGDATRCRVTRLLGRWHARRQGRRAPRVGTGRLPANVCSPDSA